MNKQHRLWQCIGLVCGCLLAGSLKAQVLITPQLPPTGLLRKDQLWNMVIISNNANVQQIQLQITIADSRTGQKVLTGASRVLTITKGARMLQVSDVNPVQYNYSSTANFQDPGSGLLPAGQFQVCYAVLDQNEKNSQPAQEECVPVSIDPISPPQLNQPGNQDTVLTSYPLFQWIPPVPLNMFSDLQYDFMLVEQLSGQSPIEAIQKNSALYFQQGIRSMFLAYPSSAKALEEGKNYAWQVIARNGTNYAEKTDAWTFALKKESVKKIIDYAAYPSLKQGSTGDYFICQQKITCSYKNEINDSTATMQFFTQSSENTQPIYQQAVRMVPGMNYIDFSIKGNRVFQDGSIYLMRLVNSRHDIWTLRFKYQPLNQ